MRSVKRKEIISQNVRFMIFAFTFACNNNENRMFN